MKKNYYIKLFILLLFSLHGTDTYCKFNPSSLDAKKMLQSRWEKNFPDDIILSISKSSKTKPWIISYFSKKKNSHKLIRFYSFKIKIKRDNIVINGFIEIKYIYKSSKGWKYHGINVPRHFISKGNKQPIDGSKDIELDKKQLHKLFMKLLREQPGEFITHGPEFPIKIIKSAFHLDRINSNIENKIYIYLVYFRLSDKTLQKYYCKSFTMTVRFKKDALIGKLKKQLTGGCKKY